MSDDGRRGGGLSKAANKHQLAAVLVTVVVAANDMRDGMSRSSTAAAKL